MLIFCRYDRRSRREGAGRRGPGRDGGGGPAASHGRPDAAPMDLKNDLGEMIDHENCSGI